MGWTRQQNVFLSFALHVPVLLGRSQKAAAETSVQLWPWSAKRDQKCRDPSQSLGYSSGGSKSMACYDCSAKEPSLQCSRWWSCLAGLGTARSRHRATSAFALFLRRCPSGTSPSAANLKSPGPIKSPIKSPLPPLLPTLPPLIPLVVHPSPSLLVRYDAAVA
jgi:hypothetical protein